MPKPKDLWSQRKLIRVEHGIAEAFASFADETGGLRPDAISQLNPALQQLRALLTAYTTSLPLRLTDLGVAPASRNRKWNRPDRFQATGKKSQRLNQSPKTARGHYDSK